LFSFLFGNKVEDFSRQVTSSQQTTKAFKQQHNAKLE
jgi:hypothetical protein